MPMFQVSRSVSGRICRTAIVLCSLAAASHAMAAAPTSCSSKEVAAAFADFGRTGKMPPEVGRWLYDPKGQYVEPWRAFDNVYYVGICWVSAWLITSDKGHILIDTLHEPFTDQLLENIRKFGVDPKDIKYVLITHGHFDHAGGAAKLKPLLNARFVMTETGWSEGKASAQASESGPAPWKMIDRDLVAKDGDTFSVGDVTVRLHETPGHTFGTASYTYEVKDGKSRYRVITVGGLGLNAIKDASQVEAYIASVQKIRALVTAPDRPITVHLTTHPFSIGMFEAAAGLKSRKPGDPHPLDNQAVMLKQLDGLEANAKERLIVERDKQK